MILLLSPNWLESEWCNWEFTTFTKNKKRPIIPILWEEVASEIYTPHSRTISEAVLKAPYITFKNDNKPFNKEKLPKEALEMVDNLVKKISTYLTT